MKVIGRHIKGVEDVLEHYICSTVEFKENDTINTYPMIYPHPNAQIKGLLIEVTKQELEQIDIYESEAYLRKKVKLSSGTMAWVYRSPEEKPTTGHE